VPYGRIYDVLSELERKGLVKSKPGKTRHYMPGDPEQLAHILHERKAQLEAAEKALEHLKQVYDERVVEPVQIATGKANFYKLLKEQPSPEKYSYTIKYTSQFFPEWVRKNREQRERGVAVHHLARIDEETREDINKWLTEGAEIRPFENQGVAISINEKSVAIGLIKANTTILIQDEAFADIMIRLHDAAYEQAPRADTLKKNKEVRR
jgi:sugar-specific transcriptional regulator TrmB